MQISRIFKPFVGDLILRLGPNWHFDLLNKGRLFHRCTIMASNENKENEAIDNSKEQEVTIEKVVAKDNKGIDYDKLISEFLNCYS